MSHAPQKSQTNSLPSRWPRLIAFVAGPERPLMVLTVSTIILLVLVIYVHFERRDTILMHACANALAR